MFSTLVMLAYALSEKQWKDGIINNQHLFNECVLYTLSVFMLCFNNWIDPLMRDKLGLYLIAVVLIFVIFNTITMLIISFRLFILFIRKLYFRRKQRNLGLEAGKVAKKIRYTLNDKSRDEMFAGPPAL